MVEEFEYPKIVQMRLLVANNRLKEDIKRHGYSQTVFAKLVKINWVTLSRIINLRQLPTENQQIAIACALEKPIDYLFPETLMGSVERKIFANRTKLLDENQVKQITGPPMLLLTDGGLNEVEEVVDHELLSDKLQKVLSTLKPREQRVIALRFGLNGNPAMTLEEAGRQLDVSRERIAQIERKALKKLRHPSRSKQLKDFLPPESKPQKICERCGKPIELPYLRERPRSRICYVCKTGKRWGVKR